MKLRALAITLLTANFAMTSVAQAQYGMGAMGGMPACPYPNGAAAGATAEDDEISDLLADRKELNREKRDLDKDIKELERDLTDYRKGISDAFKPHWALVIAEHIELGRDCDVCGQNRPTQPPPPTTQPPPPTAPPPTTQPPPTAPPPSTEPPPTAPPPTTQPPVNQEPPVVISRPPPRKPGEQPGVPAGGGRGSLFDAKKWRGIASIFGLQNADAQESVGPTTAPLPPGVTSN
ncbi:MAG: hypothetical protein V4760_13390, partial [Bdellovibrionota bacterium]